MRCSTCREQLSAELDGEVDVELLPATHAHLTGCPACAQWFSRAAHVNRLVRTAPADPAPGLTEQQLASVLDELPRPSSYRRVSHLLARVALACVGLGQAALGTIALVIAHTAGPGAGHPGAPAADVAGGAVDGSMMGGSVMGGSMMGGSVMGGSVMGGSVMGADLAHLAHESSAWNLALGVAFLAGALWTRHLAGTLPVLGSFVLVLSLVSAVDLIAGNVDTTRVGSHALIVAGLGLIVAILASRPSGFAPRPARVGQPVEPQLDASAPAPSPRDSAAPGRPNPAARHRAA